MPSEPSPSDEDQQADELEAHLALQPIELNKSMAAKKSGWMSPSTLHEVFLNPGIFLLFGGIAIGFIACVSQGEKVTAKDDVLFINLFHGFLCVFLLEMGITASKKMKDLKAAGWPFVAFALIAPNVFATRWNSDRARVQHVPRATIRHRHVCSVRGSLWCFIVYRRTGGSASGDPGSQPHIADCGIVGCHVQLHRHDRNSRLHHDRDNGHEDGTCGSKSHRANGGLVPACRSCSLTD